MTLGDNRVTPGERLSALRRALETQPYIRVIEAHSGLSGIVADTVRFEADDGVREFDAIWESSLTDSGSKGLPDASIVGTESRLHTINEILQVTTKPLIVDGDTGGEIPQFEFLLTSLERMGVSAVIIEDKVFPKRNSLDANASQTLEDPRTFSAKIQAGKQVLVTDDFMIIARLESLIANTGLEDALDRAEQYIKAGADGLMIHSNKREPDDLFAFVAAFDSMCSRVGARPVLVGVPTTYNQYTEEQLANVGFKVIIHANHLLRASYMAMTETAQSILEHGRSHEADELIAPVRAVFSAVGFDRVTAGDQKRSAALRLPIIIPAAGKDSAFPDGPKSLIRVAGRRILDFQMEAIATAGLKQIIIVRGYGGDQYDAYAAGSDNITFCENGDFESTGLLRSLMVANEHMDGGFILAYSDILFDAEIISRIIRTRRDIVLAVDSSYRYHKHEIDKKLDLVTTQRAFSPSLRSLRPLPVTPVLSIGKNLELDMADSEFIGLAYFSEQGAKALKQTYEDSLQKNRKPFHEASSIRDAAFTDIVQELIARGFPVHGLGVSQGWMEIHRPEDVQIAETELFQTLERSK